ncbi:16S rRNA (guanine(527)-N(7))-methyltransferase RsmG [Acidipila sp. EB88]|uniref:16S rRNA (guanine(527)-N(7))-methyltransferase RsmG n=1 Tax=Acidipila sp. EB88 TaxID=2305226 RepID=UPI000F5F514E|nr:16S rRNA (guanine(527)-N(7))-methyltransferase RsmG [Acidipila sp. EB88]RRA48200.1 16S rRNA (guanine(527)-N(7))-methyltransferase RsmG [Acidipila sp. EB88]
MAPATQLRRDLLAEPPASLSAETIASLLQQRSGVVVSQELAARLADYLALLLRWNARTNLSAIREPAEMVVRHFGEGLQCARSLPVKQGRLLDYGSGAGFPGALCALDCPGLQVLLAESQNKKAAFLQELCRDVVGDAQVHAGRVEELPAAARFDLVTLRAVDRMELATKAARALLRPGGWLVVMTTRAAFAELAPTIERVAWRPSIALQGTEQGIVAVARVLQG